MKTRDWQKLFGEQSRLGKQLFTTTELANATGTPRRVINVEMVRLVRYGVVNRYARGLYGLPENVSLEKLVAALDPYAYVTGMYALVRHGLVTQVPAVVTCFTVRRHYHREWETPAGRIEFVCVKPPVYRREVEGTAGPEQALCDFVYLALRRGTDPRSLATFRRLTTLKPSLLSRVVKRYPSTVARCVAVLPGIRNHGQQTDF
ncbi:MAG: hypothetical protein V2A79_17130 [Planctomycetota bacterium]